MTKSPPAFDPSRLLAHVKEIYARYESGPLEWSRKVKPDRPFNKGIIKIVLELDKQGKDYVQPHLEKSDFSPLQEVLHDWLNPKTKKYAMADIAGGNLSQPHGGMLINVKGRDCLEITLQLEPYGPRREELNDEQRSALVDAITHKMQEKLAQYRYAEGNSARTVEELQDSAAAKMTQSQEGMDFAHDCIDYFRERDLEKVNKKLLADIRAAGEAYMQRMNR